VEARLVKHLNIEKEKEVTVSVEELISRSMRNYYFEQIGDAILAMRQATPVGELRNGAAQAEVAPLRRKVEELVKAYNQYAEQKISVAEVIPSELQSHFGFSV
jgi:hypothetical protein